MIIKKRTNNLKKPKLFKILNLIIYRSSYVFEFFLFYLYSGYVSILMVNGLVIKRDSFIYKTLLI